MLYANRPSDEVDSHSISGDGRLTGRTAVVTGAGSGIGKALTIALSQRGVRVCAVGRNLVNLAATVAAAEQSAPARSFSIDVTAEGQFQPLLEHLNRIGRLHILIHCAGVIRQGPMEESLIEDLDLQYATNVRAPYLLTQRLLPLLALARGQIVFINSSVGLTAKHPQFGQYAATKHALKAVADSLREEVNSRGIRVLSVYPGRTATPLQRTLYEQQEALYRPEILLQPEDIASVVVHALTLPPTAEVTDLCLRPLQKSY